MPPSRATRNGADGDRGSVTLVPGKAGVGETSSSWRITTPRSLHDRSAKYRAREPRILPCQGATAPRHAQFTLSGISDQRLKLLPQECRDTWHAAVPRRGSPGVLPWYEVSGVADTDDVTRFTAVCSAAEAVDITFCVSVRRLDRTHESRSAESRIAIRPASSADLSGPRLRITSAKFHPAKADTAAVNRKHFPSVRT